VILVLSRSSRFVHTLIQSRRFSLVVRIENFRMEKESDIPILNTIVLQGEEADKEVDGIEFDLTPSDGMFDRRLLSIRHLFPSLILEASAVLLPFAFHPDSPSLQAIGLRLASSRTSLWSATLST
jgi:hypothetical protein